jgi:hypothetical protein
LRTTREQRNEIFTLLGLACEADPDCSVVDVLRACASHGLKQNWNIHGSTGLHSLNLKWTEIQDAELRDALESYVFRYIPTGSALKAHHRAGKAVSAITFARNKVLSPVHFATKAKKPKKRTKKP